MSCALTETRVGPFELAEQDAAIGYENSFLLRGIRRFNLTFGPA